MVGVDVDVDDGLVRCSEMVEMLFADWVCFGELDVVAMVAVEHSALRKRNLAPRWARMVAIHDILIFNLEYEDWSVLRAVEASLGNMAMLVAERIIYMKGRGPSSLHVCLFVCLTTSAERIYRDR